MITLLPSPDTKRINAMQNPWDVIGRRFVLCTDGYYHLKTTYRNGRVWLGDAAFSTLEKAENFASVWMDDVVSPEVADSFVPSMRRRNGRRVR